MRYFDTTISPENGRLGFPHQPGFMQGSDSREKRKARLGKCCMRQGLGVVSYGAPFEKVVRRRNGVRSQLSSTTLRVYGCSKRVE